MDVRSWEVVPAQLLPRTWLDRPQVNRAAFLFQRQKRKGDLIESGALNGQIAGEPAANGGDCDRIRESAEPVRLAEFFQR
jgi:hypothetical protein